MAESMKGLKRSHRCTEVSNENKEHGRINAGIKKNS